MHPVTYQPELGRWSQAWRYLLVVAIGAFAWFALARWQWEHQRWWFWTDLGLGLLSLALVTRRRQHPVAVTTATNLLTCVSASAGGAATLSLVSLAARRRWREILPIGMVALGGSFALESYNPASDESFALTGPFILMIVAVTVGWGMYIGSRRELLATLRERAETAESEQTARVHQARSAERSRIAREMHDVLAHRISLVTMHAGALAYRTDLSPEEVRATAGVIQDNSHQAMVELREVLGLLRDDPGDASPELPQPSATDLPGLIDEARRSGMRIRTDREIHLDGVPVALGRTVYRVVQEGLTNARKHATDTLVTIDLNGDRASGLTIQVRNLLPVGRHDRAVPTSGLGLVGLTERAELAGGRLTHHVTPAREFVLQAWLPWPA
ncbi:MAG: two-component sensor histidine kinase [Aeromicrobium sp.]|uniref:sensor histidine kinase n=1 Tax=Aeromicrobium sp. TaxID=1871063 RepID=UPI002610C54E|nr:histidine kinase [Aeromicrobium sp.]MCW2824573.1 two-component sensor histidine kinase [Aeromicrobium sp.]